MCNYLFYFFIVKDIATGSMHAEQVINVLAESYKSSEICMQVQGEISAICQQVHEPYVFHFRIAKFTINK